MLVLHNYFVNFSLYSKTLDYLTGKVDIIKIESIRMNYDIDLKGN